MQLTFKSIRWKNLLSTGNVFTEIDLQKSSDTLIIGENGAGKSTIIDALTFACYNKPFRDIGKPGLINTINDRDCVVELELGVGSNEYKIVRGIKPNIFEIYQNGNLIKQDAATKDYQKWLETHVLKMNFKAFSQIVVLGSDSYIPFMRLKSSRRREVIEEILDIQIFSSMNVILKRKLQLNKEHLETNRQSNTILEERRSTLKKHVGEIEEDKDKRRISYNMEIDAATKENLKLEELIQNNMVALDPWTQTHENLKTQSIKLDEYKILNVQISQKCIQANKTITFYEDNSNCPTCIQELEENFKIAEVAKHKHTVSQYQAALTKLFTKIKTLNDSMSILQTEIKAMSAVKTSNMAHTTKMEGNNQYIGKLKKYLKELDAPPITSNNNNKSGTITLDDVEMDITANSKARDDLIDVRKYLDFGLTLLRDDGVKTREIRRYLPLINTLVNKHLQDMDCYVNFTLDENFEELIKSRHRDKFTYNSFSAGERLRIDLALLFTWREVAARKNSIHTNLLIMDEVFDSSLDSQGTDEFLKLIKTLINTNIFVISHRNEFLFDKFRSIIKFIKLKNFSQMGA